MYTQFSLFRLLALMIAVTTTCHAGFVEFAFALADTDADDEPLLRDVWADVSHPDGRVVSYPAFHHDGTTWKVRVRPDLAGNYRITAVFDRNDEQADTPRAKSKAHALDATFAGPRSIAVSAPLPMPSVRINPAHPLRFEFSDGRVYYPIGMNVGWASHARHAVADTFDSYFAQMQSAGLNWARIWMCHWTGLDLDWNDNPAKSPRPGQIDPRVAEQWDRLIAQAERSGVYFQMVLQHHGQFSSTTNSNWAANPWNAANKNGGFLKSPADFFSDQKALRLTKAKYRYIVARYGHSPAILAWELFNEVHWTDAARKDDALVGRWHAGMAAWLRRCDPWSHLVATSHDNLQSAVYERMDFLQPHLYASNMLASTRRFPFAPPPEKRGRPMFHGEIGDNSIPIADEEKKTGIALIPPIWTSLMADGEALPGQTWSWERIFNNTERLGEMRAIATFATAARLGERNASLAPFSPAVSCAATIPRILTPGYSWSKRPGATVIIPPDGRDTPALADLPGVLVERSNHLKNGYANRAEIRFVKTAAEPVEILIETRGSGGYSLSIYVDGKLTDAPDHGERIPVDMPPGIHSLILENTGTPPRNGHIFIKSINLTGTQPALAAAGRRSDDTVILYLWHRANIFSSAPDANTAAKGQAVIEKLPPGQWKVTWWNMREGGPESENTITHDGENLLLPTPPILRHAAVIMERSGRSD